VPDAIVWIALLGATLPPQLTLSVDEFGTCEASTGAGYRQANDLDRRKTAAPLLRERHKQGLQQRCSRISRCTVGIRQLLRRSCYSSCPSSSRAPPLKAVSQRMLPERIDRRCFALPTPCQSQHRSDERAAHRAAKPAPVDAPRQYISGCQLHQIVTCTYLPAHNHSRDNHPHESRKSRRCAPGAC